MMRKRESIDILLTAIVAHFEFTPGLTHIEHFTCVEVALKIFGWCKFVTKVGQFLSYISYQNNSKLLPLSLSHANHMQRY